MTETAFGMVNGKSVSFILDSGTTEHLVTEDMESMMNEVSELTNKICIKIANGQQLVASKAGNIKLTVGTRAVNLTALIVLNLTQPIICQKNKQCREHNNIYKEQSVDR